MPTEKIDREMVSHKFADGRITDVNIGKYSDVVMITVGVDEHAALYKEDVLMLAKYFGIIK